MCDFPSRIFSLGDRLSASFNRSCEALRYFWISRSLFSRNVESDFPFLVLIKFWIFGANASIGEIEPTSEVRFRVFNILLEYQMHNSTVDFRLRLLIEFSRAYGVFNIESHTPLSINLPSSICLQKLTPYDYTLTILPRPLVWKESGTTRQSSSTCLPFQGRQ